MQKYTLDEFNALPRLENGIIHCTAGDYSAIKVFPNSCKFEGGSIFGKYAQFGCHAHFGPGCKFGFGSTFAQFADFDDKCEFADACIFTDGADFENGCTFGVECVFSKYTTFGNDTTFGTYCSFGAKCVFGTRCTFGQGCEFGDDCVALPPCSHEGLHNSYYFAAKRIGPRAQTVYFYNSDEGFYVRAGRFFGPLDEFVSKVKKTHAGTKFEAEYLQAAELAKIVLQSNVIPEEGEEDLD